MTGIVTLRIGMMSLQASVLILIILLIRKVLTAHHVSKRYSCWLWVLVCIRLLCPFWIESDLNGLSVIHAIENKVTDLVSGTEPFSSDLPDEAAADINNTDTDNTYIDNVDTTNADIANADIEDKSLENREPSSSDKNGNPVGLAKNFIKDFVKDFTKDYKKDFTKNFALRPFLPSIYLSGAAATAIVYLAQYVALKRKIAAAIRDEEGIWYSEFISAPFVLGVLRARIYLPYGLEGKDKKQILLHEQMHIAHHDPVLHLVGTICRCIHWWNPLVWLAIRCMNADAELYCDEQVIGEFSWPERKAYAKLLLSFAIHQSNLMPGIYFGKSNTELRITNIFEDKRRRCMLVPAAGAMALASFFLLMTAPARSTAYAIDYPSGHETAGGSNLQDELTAAAESDKPEIMDEQSIEGVWAATGEYSLSRVCAMSEQDIQNYLDVFLVYREDRYQCADTEGEVTWAVQGYDMEGVTADELWENYSINPGALGIPAGGRLYIYAAKGDNHDIAFGETVFLLNENAGYYSLVTDLPKSEVEAFAKQVRECVVSQDWSRLAAFMCDSVTVDGDTYSVKDFDQMDFSRVNADFISAIEAESCQDMFCNWQGIMLGNGEIWISAVTDEDEEKTLCVTAINGLLS